MSFNRTMALVDALTDAQISYGNLRGLELNLRQLLAEKAEDLAPARLGDAANGRVGKEAHEPLVVTIISRNKCQTIAVILASLACGVVVNPLNPELTATELDVVLAHSAPLLVIKDAEIEIPADYAALPIQAFFDALVEADEGYDFRSITGSLLIYTSGTTGKPKGVLLAAEQLLINAESGLRELPYCTGDDSRQNVTASVLPPYHTFTLVSDVFPALLSGAYCVVFPNFEMRHMALLQEQLTAYPIRSYSAVPLIFNIISRLRIDFTRSQVAFAISGAAPLANEVRTAYESTTGHVLIPCYGMTEACCFIAISPRHAIRPGSCGKPILPLRIIDDHGNQTGPNVAGEIEITGRSVIKLGYFKDAGQFSDLFDKYGWFRTGDVAYLDEDGYLFIAGRKKNMVIRGGEKVHLEDIESCLAGMSCAAVSIVSPAVPDRIVLFKTPDAPDNDEIVRRIKLALGSKHLPDEIRMIEEIPLTPTGKIVRARLAALV
ncbi:acyl--CoA ligase [Pseudomonas sp. J452]|uniref:class I adenylate-forming enzyme family protein n=1 Tax=Pseudomonas sp. J452 TaxID=2898441 RepID=UPI0021ADC410|nr:class I adenylate-forming enzyme family protein [Pseudomonas sp. J452]UUY08386.1 acyl--CoA ligase [Pseudomonas sp. J452]